jgi:predicted SAM-dependent methyltransferase
MLLNYINLGCGSHFHRDWINVDYLAIDNEVITHNLRNGIPFANDKFEVVYHSHILEHFSKKEAVDFISECYRVLKKDGIIRVVVPDLEQIAKEYLNQLQLALNGENQADLNYNWIMLELFDQTVRNQSGGDMFEYLCQDKIANEVYVTQRIGNEAKKIREGYLKSIDDTTILHKDEINKKQKVKTTIKALLKFLFTKSYDEFEKSFNIGKFRQSGEIHQWMYDKYSLSKVLNEAGFMNIMIKSAYDSEIPGFSTFNLDVINGEVRKPDSLFIEAIK